MDHLLKSVLTTKKKSKPVLRRLRLTLRSMDTNSHHLLELSLNFRKISKMPKSLNKLMNSWTIFVPASKNLFKKRTIRNTKNPKTLNRDLINWRKKKNFSPVNTVKLFKKEKRKEFVLLKSKTTLNKDKLT